MWSLSPISQARSVAPSRQPAGSLVDRMFNDFFSDDFFNRGWNVTSSNGNGVAAARVDIADKGDNYEVRADLPGVDKKDVKVSVDDNLISIEAEVQREEEKKEGERVVYSERYASKFMRQFTLPGEVDASKADAKLENGVLTLTLPKKASVAARQLTVS